MSAQYVLYIFLFLPISKLPEMFPLAGDAFGALGEAVWNGDASDLLVQPRKLQFHSCRNLVMEYSEFGIFYYFWDVCYMISNKNKLLRKLLVYTL